MKVVLLSILSFVLTSCELVVYKTVQIEGDYYDRPKIEESVEAEGELPRAREKDRENDT